MSRRSTCRCSPPNAVPQDATAVRTPAACMAMTSVYPSTMTAWCDWEIFRLAKSRPKSTFDLRYSIVSGVFMYLPSLSSSKSLRAPNPMTLPAKSLMGHSRRRWKRSIGPRLPILEMPAFSNSSKEKPCRRRCFVAVSQPAGA